MEKRPRISVIIPVYQVKRYLKQCLESVLSQSFGDFEVILVDDGSKDGSDVICDEYATRDNRFRVIHVENGGVSKARNLGIEKAKGDYLVFVDSDDWVEPDYFQSLVPYLREYDMLFYGAKIVSDNGLDKKLGYKTKLLSSVDSSLPSVVYSLFETGILGYMCFMCINRSLLINNKIRLNETISLHEDALFTYECLMYADKICSLPIQPYRYRVNMNGETLSMKLPDNYPEIALLRVSKMENLLDHIGLDDGRKNEILSFLKYCSYSGSLDWACKQPDKIQAIREIFIQLESLSDFRVESTFKTCIIHWAIRNRNPYIVWIGKWLGHFFPKKNSVSMI